MKKLVIAAASLAIMSGAALAQNNAVTLEMENEANISNSGAADMDAQIQSDAEWTMSDEGIDMSPTASIEIAPAVDNPYIDDTPASAWGNYSGVPLNELVRP
jgi:hypothetical protein